MLSCFITAPIVAAMVERKYSSSSLHSLLVLQSSKPIKPQYFSPIIIGTRIIDLILRSTNTTLSCGGSFFIRNLSVLPFSKFPRKSSEANLEYDRRCSIGFLICDSEFTEDHSYKILTNVSLVSSSTWCLYIYTLSTS